MTRQTLRPYQAEIIARIDAAAAEGRRRAICCLPTGAGKTTVAAEKIHHTAERGGSVLFLAHRRELIDQASGRLDEHGVAHGVIMAGTDRYSPRRPVQVASIQTLANREAPPADLVVVDECHLSYAPSFRRLLDGYPGAQIVGLTATPWRLDGKGLGSIYDELVEVVTVEDLIGMGNLLRPEILTTPGPDLSGVRTHAGDYETRGLAAAMDTADLVGDVVGHWLQHAKGRRTVVFAVSVEHSMHLAERFRQAGVRAEHIDAGTPKERRKEVLRALKAGTIDVVCNVEILTAGWDLPALEVCVLARPTQSLSLYLQMVGRILRPCDGKPGALILDHAGCLHTHGAPWQPRAWSLVGPKDNAAKRGAAVTICRECYAALPATTRRCPHCGYQLAQQAAGQPGALPTTADGRLVTWSEERAGWAKIAQQVTKVDTWQRFLDEAERRGYSKGWAAHRYREKFGVWPRMVGGVEVTA